jgi:hypothetical protein
MAIGPGDLDLSDPRPEWTDSFDLIGGRSYFYRLTATDASGYESAPTPVLRSVAVDTAVPLPPEWTEQRWFLRREADDVLLDWPSDGIVLAGHAPALRLEYRSEVPEPQFVVTRRGEVPGLWAQPAHISIDRSATDPFLYVLLDRDATPAGTTAYRARVRSSSGVWSTDFVVLPINPPPLPPSAASEELS